MNLSTRRLVLERMTRELALSILDGTPSPQDTWAPDYPVVDELDVIPGYLDGPEIQDLGSPFGLFVIRTRTDHAACGGLGFVSRPDADGVVELGYGLVESVRGRGYATEAVTAALHAAAGHGASTVRAQTSVDNGASQRVLVKAGMTEVWRDAGTVRFEADLTALAPQAAAATDRTIRTAVAGDREAIWRLLGDLAISVTPDRGAFDPTFDALLVDPRSLVLVAATPDLGIVGYLVATARPSFVANGTEVWVAELVVDERVRRAGIGRSLIARAEDWARTCGAARVTLATSRAHDFYAALGYDGFATYFRKRLR